MISYSGTVRGFRREALPEMRRAAMRGLTLANPGHQMAIQRRLREAQVRDLIRRTAWERNGGDAA